MVIALLIVLALVCVAVSLYSIVHRNFFFAMAGFGLAALFFVIALVLIEGGAFKPKPGEEVPEEDPAFQHPWDPSSPANEIWQREREQHLPPNAAR